MHLVYRIMYAEAGCTNAQESTKYGEAPVGSRETMFGYV